MTHCILYKTNAVANLAGMFIKRNKRKSGERVYETVLLVHGERVPGLRPPGRPAKDAPPPKSRVVHRTLANLTNMPPSLVAVIDRFCRGERLVPVDNLELCTGPAYGALAVLTEIAREAGIVEALGSSRIARLALFLVLARVIHQGSRLSSVRWAEDQAVGSVLGLTSFDEDDLYSALDWLEEQHEAIERALAKHHGASPANSVFLYDVTSSYFEGQCNELAQPGYNRDGKKYKKQAVIGLLTDAKGEPISVRVYPGNRSDPTTVDDPIEVLSSQLGLRDVVFVGDRGMVKVPARKALAERGLRFLTSLTDPQIKKLLKSDKIQLELFDETPVEVYVDDRRLILRRNSESMARHRQRRADQEAKVRAKVAERNAQTLASDRCKPETSLRTAQRRLAAYKLDRFVTAELDGRTVRLVVDEAKKTEIELLDGCYVLETDVPREAAIDCATLHDRYKDLKHVERDFRSLKTVDLEIRPIFLRKANRTRAHALVALLALKILRRLQARIAPLGITAQDAIDRLNGIRLVGLGDPTFGVWRLPTRYTPQQREVLDRLPAMPAPALSPQAGGPARGGRTRKPPPVSV